MSKTPSPTETKKKIRIPWREIKELVGALLERGVNRNDIPAIVGAGLDEIIDFDEIIQGPAGSAIEAIDGPIFTASARLILSLLPDRKLIAFARECQGRACE